MEIEQYYSREGVLREIADYARDRWVGVHCSLKDSNDRYIMVRYDKSKKPLTINKPEEVLETFKRLRNLKPRTFYSTSNLYLKLASQYDVLSLTNVYACTPYWDIDNELEVGRIL